VVVASPYGADNMWISPNAGVMDSINSKYRKITCFHQAYHAKGIIASADVIIGWTVALQAKWYVAGLKRQRKELQAGCTR